jgi:hypothetical protein
MIKLLSNAQDKGDLPTRQTDINAKGGTVRALQLIQSPDIRIKGCALRVLELLLTGGSHSVQQEVLRYVAAVSSTAASGAQAGSTIRASGSDALGFLQELDALIGRACDDAVLARTTALGTAGADDDVYGRMLTLAVRPRDLASLSLLFADAGCRALTMRPTVWWKMPTSSTLSTTRCVCYASCAPATRTHRH